MGRHWLGGVVALTSVVSVVAAGCRGPDADAIGALVAGASGDPTQIGVGGDLSEVDTSVDTDDDGIPDVIEGSQDADGDGTPAHLDPDEQGSPAQNAAAGGGKDRSPAGTEDAATPEPEWVDVESPVTLMIHEDAELSIGGLPTFAYPGGTMSGTLTDHGDGTATIFLPAGNTEVPALDIFGIGEVQIMPKDMTGTIDFCTGIVEMPFDATFRPVLAGLEQGDMSVVTDLTTEHSPGINTPDQSLDGERLMDDNTLRLVGVADVQPTDAIVVNTVLSLPADARTNMPGHLEFGGERPVCPNP